MHQFLEEIHGQPLALRQTLAYLASEAGCAALEQVRAAWTSGRYRRILTTGMGSSFFIAEALALLLERRGVPALCLNAGELLHHAPAAAGADTLTVALSQSGESYETVAAVRAAGQPKEAVVCITNAADASLAALSGTVLLTRAGREDMTSTKTFVTAWVAALALADAIAGDGGGQPAAQDLLPAAVSEALAGTGVGRAAALVGDAPFLCFVARGTDMAAARQAALMCMEALHMSATALTGGDFRHGPLEMVGPQTTVVLLSASTSPTYALTCKLAGDVLHFGGKVILVSDREDLRHDRLVTLSVPAVDADRFLIPAIVPLQLLVCALAARRGIVPGDFHHGGKVTTTE